MITQIYKKLGETPLQALERFRIQHGIHPDVRMTYAGRLDPMAEGWMYLLSESDVHHKEEYSTRNKTYTLQIIWGIETDTYDLLGIPYIVLDHEYAIDNSILMSEITKIRGETFQQVYPPYSSKTVHGKPLWKWAREKQLHTITIPDRTVTLHAIDYIKQRSITSHQLYNVIKHRCRAVTGDFRQVEIQDKWDIICHQQSRMFTITTLCITCSAGTYMRSLAHMLGKSMGCGACAFSIVRHRY